MVEQIRLFEGNVLAIEGIDSFTKTDARFIHKLFENKLEEGFKHVNVLVKVDEVKINHINAKAFLDHIGWILKNVKNIGNIAIVGQSKFLKSLVPLDNYFYQMLEKGYEERYFDASELNEAIRFVVSGEKQGV